MTSEKLPPIQPNKQFPIGDLAIDNFKQKKIDEWFEMIEDMEQEKYWAHIRYYNVVDAAEGELALITNDAAMTLCKSWDSNRKAIPAAQVGFRMVTAFNNKNRILPTIGSDLTPQLRQMTFDQSHLAEEFAHFAWQGIESYPKLSELYDRLLILGRTRYALDDETNLRYFKAGMALPYMLAWTSRLHGYTPRYSGVKDKPFDSNEELKNYLYE